MKIIKRSGVETAFDRSKITAAVTKANESVAQGKRLTKKPVSYTHLTLPTTELV